MNIVLKLNFFQVYLYFPAVLMTGGRNVIECEYLKSAEMHLPSTNTTCSLPKLPQARDDHSQVEVI